MSTVNFRLLAIIGLSLGAAGSTSASLTSTLVQVHATGAELDEAGYTQLGSSPYVSLPSSECAVNGCVTLAGTSSTSISKGYLEFQFLNFTYNPLWYSGIYAVLDVDFGGAGVTLSQIIGLINAESATTGVTALTASQANNSQGTCSFTDWLPTSLDDGLVLQWNPATPPTSPGLSQVFTVAWDFTSLQPGLQGGGVGIEGAYGLPSPGAAALLAIAGAFRGRRR
jgi:hypothetical protein